MIKLSNITKSFQDGDKHVNKVLKGVNMNVDKGEFVAIRGASGSGKTTLLSILGTLLNADEGSYMLNGEEMCNKKTDYSLIRNKLIGFVFQDHRLMPQYTALENILLPTLAHKQQTNKEDVEYAKHLMGLTGIAELAKQTPQTLSGGEASRVAVCRALIMKPLLLLADEPTGQLDAENARNIARMLSDINKNLQSTIVMVTHSKETSEVADRILNLKNGLIQ
ncbi:MAG: ABC transporter ATP-binding protein [Bacteroidales bacterium]